MCRIHGAVDMRALLVRRIPAALAVPRNLRSPGQSHSSWNQSISGKLSQGLAGLDYCKQTQRNSESVDALLDPRRTQTTTRMRSRIEVPRAWHSHQSTPLQTASILTDSHWLDAWWGWKPKIPNAQDFFWVNAEEDVNFLCEDTHNCRCSS